MLEYRHPAECHFGKCNAEATVDVDLRPTRLHAGTGRSAQFCGLHVGIGADLLRSLLQKDFERLAEGFAQKAAT
ncbi:MAG TPA: hypothetical protein VIM33_04800 [Gaiellaceae bacterium]|jgi:hypothetical protein